MSKKASLVALASVSLKVSPVAGGDYRCLQGTCFLMLCLLPQDILAILCLKGPSTEGIFRKAASEKARKELKEELNCGGSVDLKQLPVHLLAVVFKVSLRQLHQMA